MEDVDNEIGKTERNNGVTVVEVSSHIEEKGNQSLWQVVNCDICWENRVFPNKL